MRVPTLELSLPVQQFSYAGTSWASVVRRKTVRSKPVLVSEHEHLNSAHFLRGSRRAAAQVHKDD